MHAGESHSISNHCVIRLCIKTEITFLKIAVVTY